MIEEEEIKLSLFSKDMIVYTENPKAYKYQITYKLI